MKRMAIIIGSTILLSCSKGIWVTENVYRPKKPNYSLVRQRQNTDSLIDCNHLYIPTNKFVNYDGRVTTGYMGFYKDGRLIVDNMISGAQLPIIRNSYETASYAGYYTTSNGRLVLEYFIQTGGGQYFKRIGYIKKDTVIVEKSLRNLFFNIEYRYDTLVKSSYPLK